MTNGFEGSQIAMKGNSGAVSVGGRSPINQRHALCISCIDAAVAGVTTLWISLLQLAHHDSARPITDR